MKDFQITKNFSFFEVTKSDSYPELEKKNRKYILARPELLAELVKNVCLFLQPVRDFVGSPIFVNSGFRFPKLNKRVGGSPYSQHKAAQAFDLGCSGMNSFGLFKKIKLSKVKWHQLRCYISNHFVHYSVPTGVRDMQETIIE